MAFTAAAMYGGATIVVLAEGLTPTGPNFSLVPGFAALALASLLVVVGPRLPEPVLATLGPIGAALIAFALGSTEGAGDGALLYIWPVLWVAYFFGRTGSVLIVAWIGVVHALALISLPPDSGYLDRWLDVMVSVAVVAAVVHALSERNRSLLARLAAEARVDQLTGVLNRRGFEERARSELERARRGGLSVAAVSFDIDHFKRINDEFGHDAGDRVLSHLGAVLCAKTRSADVVTRMGGEEFAALLPGADADHALAYAERVRAGFSAADDPALPRATVSAGVTAAVAPESIEALLVVADFALHAAKRAGRDRTIVDHQPASAGAKRARARAAELVAGRQ